MQIAECIIIRDVAPERLALIRSQDRQLHFRRSMADINRQLREAMPPPQAGFSHPIHGDRNHA